MEGLFVEAEIAWRNVEYGQFLVQGCTFFYFLQIVGDDTPGLLPRESFNFKKREREEVFGDRHHKLCKSTGFLYSGSTGRQVWGTMSHYPHDTLPPNIEETQA